MKELKHFNKLTEAMVINPNDFGGHYNLDDVDINTGLTYLETGMAELVGDIAAQGIDSEEAQKVVEDAIKELIKMNALTTPPEEHESDGAKAMWLSHAKPKVKAHLQLMGLIY